MDEITDGKGRKALRIMQSGVDMRQASWGSLHKAKYPTRPKMRANIKLPNSIKDVKIKDEHISGLLSKNNALSEELAALKVEIKASNEINTEHETEIADLHGRISNMTPSYQVQLRRWEDAKESLWTRKDGHKQNYMRDTADVALLESKEQTSLVADSRAKEIFDELFNASWFPYAVYTLEQLRTAEQHHHGNKLWRYNDGGEDPGE
ncbi:hypothetical protein IFR04_010640 [Cadophora malorum]|uniref:Uncharacterized protein n=1 Tax=Cadophora malorum TaxID=108018 RepID=A0A8H7TBT3_9HELO|nr:hypothetical protein IFR04_010640 [Cadophora malorum]